MDDVVAANGLSQDDAKILKAGFMVDLVIEDLKFVTESIQDEFNARELLTLNTSQAGNVKLPKFENYDDN